jgi:hypothetical protein
MVNNIILFDTMTSTFLFMIVIVWIASETEWEGIYAYANDSVYSKASSEKKIVNMITWPFLIRSVTVIMISVAGFWWVRGEVVKLNMAWNELFSKPPIRTELYKKGEDASPYGAGISFAQRADDYGQVYLSKQSNIKNQREREIILQDIEAIVATLDYDLKRYPPNMQSYQALGNLAVSYLEIMQSAQQGRLESVLGVQSEHKTYWLNRLEEAHDRLKQMAPLNPRVTFFERKLDELR